MFSKEELITILFALKFMLMTPELPGADKIKVIYDKVENMILDKEQNKELKA